MPSLGTNHLALFTSPGPHPTLWAHQLPKAASRTLNTVQTNCQPEFSNFRRLRVTSHSPAFWTQKVAGVNPTPPGRIMDASRSQAPHWHFRENRPLALPGERKSCALQPWEVSGSEEPSGAQTQGNPGSFSFPPPPHTPHWVRPQGWGFYSKTHACPLPLSPGCHPRRPLFLLDRNDLLLALPPLFSPPSNHLHPAASSPDPNQIMEFSHLKSSGDFPPRTMQKVKKIPLLSKMQKHLEETPFTASSVAKRVVL